MNYIPKLEDFMRAWEDNRVFKCENEHYVGFKYNICTVYTADWDNVTLSARGIAFDKETGECVCYPFTKFFNYQELYTPEGTEKELLAKVKQFDAIPNFAAKFRVMDKLDGSLGCAFYDKYTNHWVVKTGGSFESDQAIWATKWLNDNVDTRIMRCDTTYCFEIIYNEDLHPITYDFEGLVLLGMLNNKTYKEYDLDYLKAEAEILKVRMAEVYEFNNFNEVIPFATNLPNNKEGVVVTFVDDNGYTTFKVKLKGVEFLELQKKFHAITPEEIWKNMNPDTGLVDEEYLKTIPEEMPDMKALAKTLENKFAENRVRIFNFLHEKGIYEQPRVDVYKGACIVFKDAPELINGAMKGYTAILKNIDYKSYLDEAAYKSIKP